MGIPLAKISSIAYPLLILDISNGCNLCGCLKRVYSLRTSRVLCPVCGYLLWVYILADVPSGVSFACVSFVNTSNWCATITGMKRATRVELGMAGVGGGGE